MANYVSGSIAVLPVQEDGSLAEAVDRHQDEGPAGAERPAAAVEGSFAISDHNGPHAHMIAADPSGKYVYSTDLGLDRIYQYRLDSASGKANAERSAVYRRLVAGSRPAPLRLYATGRRPVAD